MSEFVLVSDIHGNALSLEEVISREGDEKEYIILGDIHGLLAQPAETLELVRSLDGITIAGNHDKAIFHEGVGHVNSPKLSEFELSHTIINLTLDQIDYMQELSFMEVFRRDGNRICATHAYPWPTEASGYESGNAGIRKDGVIHVASEVSNDYDYVFHGHTHEQYSLDCERFGHDVHFVNPGSLGWGDTYAVVDTDTGDVDLRSVEYDHSALKEHVQHVLPDSAPHTDEWL